MIIRPKDLSPALPQFNRPPVVETVLGVQFDKVSGFTNAHLGLFWQGIKEKKFLGSEDDIGDSWDAIVDVPPIEMTRELFGNETRWKPQGLRFQLNQVPESRSQIRNHSKTRMIQAQNGRLHLNWTGHEGGGSYPSYTAIKPQFEQLFEGFKKFLSANNLGSLKINQWELTYVNHIPRGMLWDKPAEWTNVFVGLPAIAASESDMKLEGMGGEWHYVIGDQLGRLHINISHARKTDDGTELLRATLTARGPAKDDDSLQNGFAEGHSAIVRMFKSITTTQAHLAWEIIQ